MCDFPGSPDRVVARRRATQLQLRALFRPSALGVLPFQALHSAVKPRATRQTALVLPTTVPENPHTPNAAPPWLLNHPTAHNSSAFSAAGSARHGAQVEPVQEVAGQVPVEVEEEEDPPPAAQAAPDAPALQVSAATGPASNTNNGRAGTAGGRAALPPASAGGRRMPAGPCPRVGRRRGQRSRAVTEMDAGRAA